MPSLAVVVDDNHLIMLHAAEILEEAGFETHTAFTAEQALAILEANAGRIVVLFTDVEMPPGEMDGFELARETARRWPDIGILVASAKHLPTEDDLPAGAHFIAKPFSAEVVYEGLHRIMPDHHKPDPLKTKRI